MPTVDENPESNSGPGPDPSPEHPAKDGSPPTKVPVRHRLPRRYRRRPKRGAALGSSWIGWLLLACLPAFLLLAIDQLDLRRPASQDFADAQAMHRDLIERYQRDAYLQPEAQAVIARLERVPASSRNYAEAQDLLQRYRWETERAADAEAAPAEPVVVEGAPRIWHPAPPSASADPGLAAGAAGTAHEIEPTLGSDSITPTLPAEEPPPSGWSSMAPSKPRSAPATDSADEARATSDRELAARVGIRCYTATFGLPTAREDARFDVRLGTESSVRIGGLRVRNLRDLREALHRLIASDAALGPLDTYLSRFSEDTLGTATLEVASGSHWLWVDSERAPVFVDLLGEAARCQGRAPGKAPLNSTEFGPGPTAGPDATVLTLPIDGVTEQGLEVRVPSAQRGGALELLLRATDRFYPIARFPLAAAGGSSSR